MSGLFRCCCGHWPRFHGPYQGSLDETSNGCALCRCGRYAREPRLRAFVRCVRAAVGAPASAEGDDRG